ncbi:hypothetical protein B0H67DRAFT_577005 [Lasiosphaeris hirsuta]|uniref:Uncharacterized protein n=1 Tax=Lasiosphaeris hirsuta TaxID=260670 RepID=A0AA40ARJ2_9PEZI|nr:hypothetical protein B0H67DRAFT_577005 [Lasiosphaeris hirsuta]
MPRLGTYACMGLEWGPGSGICKDMALGFGRQTWPGVNVCIYDIHIIMERCLTMSVFFGIVQSVVWGTGEVISVAASLPVNNIQSSSWAPGVNQLGILAILLYVGVVGCAAKCFSRYTDLS